MREYVKMLCVRYKQDAGINGPLRRLDVPAVKEGFQEERREELGED